MPELPQSVLELVLDEGKWLFGSMLFAALAVLVTHSRVLRMSQRREVLRVMNVFYGTLIGTMAFGHLLAVTVKVVQGTVEGFVPVLYGLGLALAIPAWLLAVRIKQYVLREDSYGGRIVLLNLWLAIVLLGLGLHNFPLAIPAVLNVAYQFHTRRIVGLSIVTVTFAANLALFVGSLVFLASGQSFEQFSRME